MIPFAGPNWFIYPHSRYVQSTGFNRGLLAFGDTAAGVLSQNRSLSFSTYTETVHTNMSTGARIQSMPCASPTHVYQMKGYSGGYISTVNKQAAFTNAESTTTISFSVERRGGMYPMPHIKRDRMYYAGGYSDALGTYRTDITWVTQATETPTNSSATLIVGSHMGATMFNRTDAFFVAGYTTGGGSSNWNGKYTFVTDTLAVSTGLGTAIQNPTCFSSDINGYKIQGVNRNQTTNEKFSFSTTNWSVSTNSPESQTQLFGANSYVNQYEGTVWGGYQSFTKRILYRLSWASETYTNSSYTTADASSGFIYYHGTY